MNSFGILERQSIACICRKEHDSLSLLRAHTRFCFAYQLRFDYQMKCDTDCRFLKMIDRWFMITSEHERRRTRTRTNDIRRFFSNSRARELILSLSLIHDVIYHHCSLVRSYIRTILITKEELITIPLIRLFSFRPDHGSIDRSSPPATRHHDRRYPK